MFEPNTKVVIDSEIKTFVFKLEDEVIKYDIFDSSLNPLDSSNLTDKGIKIYSVFIDMEDTIHLVALMTTGELNYYKYIDEEWLKGKIANFDVKSNIYNQIEIFIVKTELHLIYNYSNLINSNIWTIQHVIYDKKNGGKHNIIRYLSKRVPDSFFVDIDNMGTIHLLYKNNISSISQVYHTFYNPYSHNWVSVPKQISSDKINNLNPYIFIDSSNNLHSLLIEELKDSYKLKYLRMSSNGREKYIWKEIILPYITVSNFPPIVFQEDNILKILYQSNDRIEYLLSTNYGITWSLDSTENILKDNISVFSVSSNLSVTNHKIKHGYVSNLDIPKVNFLDIYSSNSFFLENIKPEIPIEEIIEEISEEKVEEEFKIDPNMLTEINNKIEELLLNYQTYESFISMIVSNQVNIENTLNNIQSSLEENKQSFLSRIFNPTK